MCARFGVRVCAYCVCLCVRLSVHMCACMCVRMCVYVGKVCPHKQLWGREWQSVSACVHHSYPVFPVLSVDSGVPLMRGKKGSTPAHPAALAYALKHGAVKWEL